MFGSTISRWTMAHFWVAIGFFIAAQAAMTAGVAYPQESLSAPVTLATVHMVTIGWLTILMLGAMHQFLPVITAQTTVARGSALASLLAIVIGLGGMEAGFLALGGVLPFQAVATLPVGGTLVLAGILMAGTAFARILWSTRPLPFAAWFVAFGLFFLVATAVLGILMGIVFAAPEATPWPEAFADGLRLHLISGLIGWFTLTAMGVSYRLLSMFTLAPEDRGALGTAVLVLSAGGLVVAWVLGVLGAAGVGMAGQQVALVAVAGGIALYLVDVVRLYWTRRRRNLELNTLMALPAVAALGLCLAGGGYVAIAGDAHQLIGPLAYLFFFGWLSGLGLSQLYKIVPFLTWLERYGSLLGKQAVPRVQDLVDEARDRPWFVLYFAAVAAGTICGVFGWTMLWRVCITGHLVAALMIVRALWLARRNRTRQSESVAPLPAFKAAAHPPSLSTSRRLSTEQSS